MELEVIYNNLYSSQRYPSLSQVVPYSQIWKQVSGHKTL